MIKAESTESTPKQLELFSIEDYLTQIIDRDVFDPNDIVEYFQKRMIPPNNSDKYYFGVDLSDEEHKELITIFKNPREVLDFYLSIYQSPNIDGELDVFNRQELSTKIKKLLGKDPEFYINNISILKSAIIKIVQAIKNNSRLEELLQKYAEKRASRQNNNTKADKTFKIKADSRERQLRADKSEVYGKLGGMGVVKKTIKKDIIRLLSEYDGKVDFIREHIVNGDYVNQFVDEMSGVEKLSYKERGMARKLIKYYFEQLLLNIV